MAKVNNDAADAIFDGIFSKWRFRSFGHGKLLVAASPGNIQTITVLTVKFRTGEVFTPIHVWIDFQEEVPAGCGGATNWIGTPVLLPNGFQVAVQANSACRINWLALYGETN